nr:MAG TPA: hypothetical protein [Caudoviricetes sp.]DAQ03973.1 MAG TPA: hypothetical protein [Caudoviricetes sp.]
MLGVERVKLLAQQKKYRGGISVPSLFCKGEKNNGNDNKK